MPVNPEERAYKSISGKSLSAILPSPGKSISTAMRRDHILPETKRVRSAMTDGIRNMAQAPCCLGVGKEPDRVRGIMGEW
ncbi:MAG: hypothetical protein V3U24_00500 [Candidatus Neomarinimicrobiota bacterium]